MNVGRKKKLEICVSFKSDLLDSLNEGLRDFEKILSVERLMEGTNGCRFNDVKKSYSAAWFRKAEKESSASYDGLLHVFTYVSEKLDDSGEIRLEDVVRKGLSHESDCEEMITSVRNKINTFKEIEEKKIKYKSDNEDDNDWRGSRHGSYKLSDFTSVSGDGANILIKTIKTIAPTKIEVLVKGPDDIFSDPKNVQILKQLEEGCERLAITSPSDDQWQSVSEKAAQMESISHSERQIQDAINKADFGFSWTVDKKFTHCWVDHMDKYHTTEVYLFYITVVEKSSLEHGPILKRSEYPAIWNKWYAQGSTDYDPDPIESLVYLEEQGWKWHWDLAQSLALATCETDILQALQVYLKAERCCPQAAR